MVPIASDNGIMRYIPHITKTAQERNHTGYSVGRPVITSAPWVSRLLHKRAFCTGKGYGDETLTFWRVSGPSESRRLSMPAPFALGLLMSDAEHLGRPAPSEGRFSGRTGPAEAIGVPQAALSPPREVITFYRPAPSPFIIRHLCGRAGQHSPATRSAGSCRSSVLWIFSASRDAEVHGRHAKYEVAFGFPQPAR